LNIQGAHNEQQDNYNMV